MSATGIGASVKRKEDIRFITGKGRYVDDINRPGQAYAYFRALAARPRDDQQDRRLRGARSRPASSRSSPATTSRPTRSAASSAAGSINSKDGSPMKAGAHPALAHGKVRYVGDHVAVVIADTYAQARDAAEKIVVDYGVLPAVVDHGDGRQAGPAADPRRRARTTPFTTGTSATRPRPTRPSPPRRT